MAIDPYFVLSLVSIGGGVVVLAIKVCFASKCDRVKIGWGLLVIHRDVEREDNQLSDINQIDRKI